MVEGFSVDGASGGCCKLLTGRNPHMQHQGLAMLLPRCTTCRCGVTHCSHQVPLRLPAAHSTGRGCSRICMTARKPIRPEGNLLCGAPQAAGTRAAAAAAAPGWRPARRPPATARRSRAPSPAPRRSPSRPRPAAVRRGAPARTCTPGLSSTLPGLLGISMGVHCGPGYPMYVTQGVLCDTFSA